MATSITVTAQALNSRYLMFKGKLQENLKNLSEEGMAIENLLVKSL